MAEREMTNKEMVEQLQNMGVENVNPNATKEVLKKMLAEHTPQAGPASSENPPTQEETKQEEPTGTVSEPAPASDTAQILAAIQGLATSVDGLNKRVTRMETGGKNDFMNEMKEADVEAASESKKDADPRIVSIVEEILGVDFGVEIIPNPNAPGFQFSVLVPKRLSPIPGSTRPVLDPETGAYKKDPKTGEVVEEDYWPGDKRSRAVGSRDSFDLVRDHCNRVRAHIVTYYEKLKKPLPEFKLR